MKGFHGEAALCCNLQGKITSRWQGFRQVMRKQHEEAHARSVKTETCVHQDLDVAMLTPSLYIVHKWRSALSGVEWSCIDVCKSSSIHSLWHQSSCEQSKENSAAIVAPRAPTKRDKICLPPVVILFISAPACSCNTREHKQCSTKKLVTPGEESKSIYSKNGSKTMREGKFLEQFANDPWAAINTLGHKRMGAQFA